MHPTLQRRFEWAAPALIALTLLLTPALGSTRQELLQDTLKSAVVAVGALAAAFAFFAAYRREGQLRWHLGLLFPVLLMLYALASLAWSHPYLPGVEDIRWFLFSLLMFVTLNTVTRERLPLIAWGIAGGAAVATLW